MGLAQTGGNGGQVRLQGGAEAAIVFTKGEAEAKALAMRADAYKQFNEAAIIQTILTALPEIVRAAAEPMGNIENLTVLSSDGASDLVKNSTRTVAESAAMIKGLTGVDVAALVGAAMGSTAASPGRHHGNGAPAEPIEVVSEAAPIAAEPDFVAQSKAETEGQPESPPKAAESIAPMEPRSTATLEPADMVEEGAQWMAEQLRAVPDIARYAQVQLKDLAARGPRNLGSIWRVAGDDLVRSYGEWTVAQLLEKFKP